MRIVLATGGLAFDGHSLAAGSLGGSETAVICVARELAKLGHSVFVFCDCPRPGTYDGVVYQPVQEFASQCATMEIDVLIASRWSELLTKKVPAGLRVLWCHDVLTSKDDLMAGLFQTDMLMLLSDFHIDQYCSIVPELRPHIWKTSNGVDLDLIEKCKKPKIKKKLIYTSRPERGLHYLLSDILPKILEKHPDAKLYCAAYQNNLIRQNDPAAHLAMQSEQLAAKYPGSVVMMGALNKEQLYCHMSSSQLWLYPTAFPEISCISAMEAQACGTVPVTTNDFALKETVGSNSGVLFNGLPTDADYATRFADAVNSLLDNTEKLASYSSEGPTWVREAGYSWDQVAKSWVTKFEDVLRKRWQDHAEKVILELERRSDLVPAKRLADKEGFTETAARLGVEIAAVNSQSYQPTDIVQRFNAAIPRFRTTDNLVRMMGKKPKRILDWRATDAAFGLVAAKEFPESDVTILAQDVDTAARLKIVAEQSGVQNLRIVEKLGMNEGFDLVMADEHVDSAVSPANAVRSLMAWVHTGGLLAFTSRTGATGGTVENSSSDRLWNLDQADFRKMFAAPEADFHSCLQADSIGPAGDLLGHWCVCVRKTAKLDDPDVDGRKIRVRPYKSLAVCMIVKNEEDWITGCLKSVLPVADKLVVADTGSEDGSDEIAKTFGAEVRKVPFDNFSQARNASIADVDADWILWIDSDERLVGADCLRKYLQSEIYEGFTIRQNHLMIDMPRSFDLPVRVFKKKPQYQFTGNIHEQCEDVSKDPFDVAIHPALVLSDVDIAHYGYINERIRRQKTSNRNMQLLIRDVQENAPKGRMLTWVLVMRDYLNMVKWGRERGCDFSEGSFWHTCLNYAVSTYLAKFSDGTHRFKVLAEPMYQEALKWLGENGLCYEDYATPPFEVGLTMTAAIGGLEDHSLGMQTKWFLCEEEFRLHLESKGEELQSQLFGRAARPNANKASFAETVEVPNPVPVLEHGCNLFSNRAA